MNRLAVAVAAFAMMSCSLASAGVDTLCTTCGVDVDIIDEGVGSLDSGSLAIDQSPSGATSITPSFRFRSYLIRVYDPEVERPADYSANFHIDEPIIGIQTDVNSLRNGRHTLDDNGFDAGAPAGGIEDNDTVTLDGQNLSITGKVGGRGVDPIRVFVEAVAVPEATSLAVWGSVMVAGLVGFRGKRDDA